ncbi:hypothetical protein LINPERPRIM_LOCUS31232, partial [Linum perenne]
GFFPPPLSLQKLRVKAHRRTFLLSVCQLTFLSPWANLEISRTEEGTPTDGGRRTDGRRKAHQRTEEGAPTDGGRRTDERRKEHWRKKEGTSNPLLCSFRAPAEGRTTNGFYKACFTASDCEEAGE